MAGLELLHSTVSGTLRDRHDAVVCCLHWTMISNGFQCIGCGEDVPHTADGRRRSELLPAGWNSSHEMYTMQYAAEGSGDIFLLKMIRADTDLLVHLMRIRDEKVTDMTVNVRSYTNENVTSYDSAYKKIEDLQKRFKEEVLKVMKTSPTATLSQESHQRRREDRSRHEDPNRFQSTHGARSPPDGSDIDNPLAVGRGDLDPLSGGRGGGMVMDPLRAGRAGGRPTWGPDPGAGLPGGLPRGAVPPGARFDPFGPPDLDRGGGRSGPGPDHLPPPGYDDMFM